MKFERFQVTETDVQTVSELLYESNREILQYAFGKKKKTAQKRIKKLIRIGKNHYGYKNIYAVYVGKTMAGFFIGYTGKEQEERKEQTDFFTFLKLMSAYGILKYRLFVRPLFMNISLVDMRNDDFYIDDILLNQKYQHNDIESFLFKKAVECAKDNGCKRIVTDISLAKPEKKEYYESIGFSVYDKKTERVHGNIIGNYLMRYLL